MGGLTRVKYVLYLWCDIVIDMQVIEYWLFIYGGLVVERLPSMQEIKIRFSVGTDLTRWKPCFVYLFVLVFVLEFFHSYGDDTTVGEGLQILTYARHSWPLSSEGSLTYHTHCETGLPFIMVISRTRDTHTCCRAFGSGTVSTCFNDLGLSRPGTDLPHANALPIRHRGGENLVPTYPIL